MEIDFENLAPIVLFTYNRIDHTKKTINALKNNSLAKYSNLIIYSDSPKSEELRFMVEDVRNYLYLVDGFKSIRIICRDKNMGVDKSIICGVNEVIKEFGKVIVLEDDIITSVAFLEYMNKALIIYKENKNVYSITGYSYICNNKSDNLPETFFLKLPAAWSWATWEDRWNLFNNEIKEWSNLHEDKALRSRFNFDNAYDHFKTILRQAEDDKFTWDIAWYWLVFNNNGLVLWPKIGLVENIGFDGSGTHGWISYVPSKIDLKNETCPQITDIVRELPWVRKQVSDNMKFNYGVGVRRYYNITKRVVKVLVKRLNKN